MFGELLEVATLGLYEHRPKQDVVYYVDEVTLVALALHIRSLQIQNNNLKLQCKLKSLEKTTLNDEQ